MIGALAVLGALLLLGGRGEDARGRSGGPPDPPSGVLLEGATSPLCVELADDAEERARGLAGRDTIGDYDGMAFVFSREAALAIASLRVDGTPTSAPSSLLTSASFWMRDTRMSLDLIYVGADGRVNEVVTMEPCPDGNCPSYPPASPYLYAVELPADWARQFGITNGTLLKLGESCIPFDRD